MLTERTLYLHIGLPKTGTSALQLFLAQNREALLAYDIDYLPIGAFAKNREGIPASGNAMDIALCFEQKEHTDFDDCIPLQNLFQQINTSSCKQILLSSERFAPRSSVWWAAFHQYLKEQQITTKLIYYVRRQDQLAQSRYAFYAKFQNITDSPEAYIRGQSPRFWYEYTLQLIDIFGQDQVIPRVYEAAKQQGSIFADFMDIWGIPFDEQTFSIPEEQVNAGLSPQELHFLILLNRYRTRPAFARQLANQVLPQLASRQAQVGWNLIPQALYQELSLRYRDDNRKFMQNYTDLPAAYYDFPPYTSSVNLEEEYLDLQALNEVLAHTIAILDRRVHRLEQSLEQAQHNPKQGTPVQVKPGWMARYHRFRASFAHRWAQVWQRLRHKSPPRSL